MLGIELDLTKIAVIWMGGVLLLVPMMGLVARFGIAPLLDAVARLRAASGAPELGELRERLTRQEAQVAELRRVVRELAAERQFR